LHPDAVAPLASKPLSRAAGVEFTNGEQPGVRLRKEKA
jgi:hypothetical protein